MLRLLGAFLLYTGFLSTLSPAASIARAENGKLLQLTPIVHYSKKSLDLSKRLLKAQTLKPSLSGAITFRLQYETTDTQNHPIKASGLLMIPDAMTQNQKFPVISYQHGIVLTKDGVPSRASINLESMAAALIFGSMGYIVIAPDYIGLGDSPGFHPFVHAQTEASAGRDLIIAATSALKEKNISLNQQLFLVGYSQGGHATLALLRELERNPVGEFSILGCVAMAGPLDLSDTSFSESLSQPSNRSSLYFAYLLHMLTHSYGARVPSLIDLTGTEIASKIEILFDGSHGMDEIIASLPSEPQKILLPSVLNEMRTNANHPIRQVLKENNVYDWTPRSPVFLAHGRGDRDVSFRNSEKAYQTMKALGASVFLEDLGIDKNHTTAIVPAFLRAFYWIDKLALQ